MNSDDDVRQKTSPTHGVSDPPKLGEVVDLPDSQLHEDDRRWLVLYPEDYENVVIGVEDNVGLLVDVEQAGGVLRLAAEALAGLSWRDADSEEPIEDMIGALEDTLDGDGDDDE